MANYDQMKEEKRETAASNKRQLTEIAGVQVEEIEVLEADIEAAMMDRTLRSQ